MSLYEKFIEIVKLEGLDEFFAELSEEGSVFPSAYLQEECPEISLFLTENNISLVNVYNGITDLNRYHTVFRLTQNDVQIYVRCSGYYSSYNGCEMDYRKWTKVKPVLVTRVEYQKE